MDALGDMDGAIGSKGLLSETQIDVQRKELLDMFNKLQEYFANKDYDGWFALWPLFEKECRIVLETSVTSELPDFEFDLDGFEGLDVHPDKSSDQPQFNLDHLPLPTVADDWFTADVHPSVLDEYAGSPPHQASTPNELTPSAPPVKEPALLPPSPANKPVSPPPPPDQASTQLIQAYTLANDASSLITKVATDGSIKLNKNSVDHLESCEKHISAAKEALQAAFYHFMQARLVNEGESLSQIIALEDD